jgi:hypothetical protein
MTSIPVPGKVAIAGDWHANFPWAFYQIGHACARIPDESPKIILHAGDLGVWRDPSFHEDITPVLEKNGAFLWFADGNHEDHPYLAGLADDDGWITPRIRWLRRGTRWEWHGRIWLALGGAVSVDRYLRDEGLDWFPEEAVTDEQEALAIAGGPADVLLSHDAPADAPLRLMRPAPLEWQRMIPQAEEHRERLQRVCMAVQPSYVFHGHYHQGGVRTARTAWGKCRFTALDMDGRQENWGILDTETMEWEW